MNETGNEIGTSRTAVRLEFLVLIALVCSWHGTAVGGAWNTDQRPSSTVDLLTMSLDQYRQFGAHVQKRDHRKKFAAAIRYASSDRTALGDRRVPRARHHFARPADPFIPI